MRMPFQIDLTGKVVLITGVSSGIGLGTAHEFARAGACVAGCARKPESDDSVSAFLQAVEGEGCKALYVQADVTQEEELEKLVQEVIATFGRLDIVVSNAGMNVFEGAAECSESRWAYNLDLNLASHWRLANDGVSSFCQFAVFRCQQSTVLIGQEKSWSQSVHSNAHF